MSYIKMLGVVVRLWQGKVFKWRSVWQGVKGPWKSDILYGQSYLKNVHTNDLYYSVDAWKYSNKSHSINISMNKTQNLIMAILTKRSINSELDSKESFMSTFPCSSGNTKCRDMKRVNTPCKCMRKYIYMRMHKTQWWFSWERFMQ